MRNYFYLKEIYEKLLKELTGLKDGGIMFFVDLHKRFSGLKIDLEGAFPTSENIFDSAFNSYRDIILNKIKELKLLEGKKLELFLDKMHEFELDLEDFDSANYPKGFERTFNIFINFFYNGRDEDLDSIIKHMIEIFLIEFEKID